MHKWTVFLFLLLFGLQASAQETYNSSGKKGKPVYRENARKKGFDPQRLIFGGGLGFGMGYGIINFGISPVAGYRLTDRFSAGIGLGYNYYRDKYGYNSYNLHSAAQKTFPLTQHIVSGSVWGRYLIIPNLFLQAEGELNNWDYYEFDGPTQFDKDGWAVYPKNRITVPSVLLGAGFRQPLGDFASIYVLLMYDVLQFSTLDEHSNKLSPYADRLEYRIGFNIGF